ncbi:unnamed protein product [Musa textilis]
MELLPSLLVFFLLHVPLACPAPSGIRATLTHVDSSGDFTASELYRRAMRRSQHRMDALGEMLTVSGVDARATVHDGLGEYMMDLAVGTPALPFSAIMDTGSNLVWAQCQPCPCTQCFSQPTPIYDPSKSRTHTTLPCTSSQCQALPVFSYSPADCHHNYSYADTTYTNGVLGTETFTLGAGGDPVAVTGVAFGCGTMNKVGADDSNGLDNSTGIVGMARGPLSLVSQLGEERFSYCFAPFGDDKNTPLIFGKRERAGCIDAFRQRPSPLYYLSLQGITVGAILLPMPNTAFALQSDGTGGFTIDSGTTFTL